MERWGIGVGDEALAAAGLLFVGYADQQEPPTLFRRQKNAKETTNLNRSSTKLRNIGRGVERES